MSRTSCLLTLAAPFALSCGLLETDRAKALRRSHTPNAAIGCNLQHRDAGSGPSSFFQKRTDNIGTRLYSSSGGDRGPAPRKNWVGNDVEQ